MLAFPSLGQSSAELSLSEGVEIAPESEENLD